MPLDAHAIKKYLYYSKATQWRKCGIKILVWKWDSFAEHLAADVLKIIKTYALIPGEDNEDRLFWNGIKA